MYLGSGDPCAASRLRETMAIALVDANNFYVSCEVGFQDAGLAVEAF